MMSLKERLIVTNVCILLSLCLQRMIRPTWFSVIALACIVIVANLVLWRFHVWLEKRKLFPRR
jgi:hypothetical protein